MLNGYQKAKCEEPEDKGICVVGFVVGFFCLVVLWGVFFLEHSDRDYYKRGKREKTFYHHPTCHQWQFSPSLAPEIKGWREDRGLEKESQVLRCSVGGGN